MDSIALDPAHLKALAHPIRLRLLTYLRDHGPGTATELAHALGGVTSGTTSYHLRQLAKYGFVVESRNQPKGPDRRWEAAHFATRFDMATLLSNLDTRTPMLALLHGTLTLHIEWIREWLDAAPGYSKAWVDAASFTDRVVTVSPSALADLVSELRAVVSRYEDKAETAKSKQVAVCLYAFPRVDIDT
jgi:DNA-binding transcriptional ArsR family regulator